MEELLLLLAREMWPKIFHRPESKRDKRPPIPEDSLRLRRAVLATQIWSVIALTYAAGLYIPSLVTAVAITIGHSYSWRHRGNENRAARLPILAAFVFTLLWTGADLTTGFAGGQFPQAQLALYLQAVTSFDLRTRRQLYVTTLHSLLILYIASSLGFDLIFVVFLLGFTACVAALLFIAYWEEESHSALAFPLRQLLSLRGLWLQFCLGIVLLGTLAFMLIPRPIGTQLVTPLSLTLPYLGAVEAATVTPVFPFLEISGGSAGFNPEMDLRARGRPSNQIVMHVRSPVRSYWRALVFDYYDSVRWSSTAQLYSLPRGPAGRYFLPFDEEGLSQMQYSQTFYIVRPQPNVVFTGYRAVRAYFPKEQVFVTGPDEGVVQVERPLPAGTSYMVDSVVPVLDPEVLRRDSRPARPDPRYLQLPAVSDRVKNLALEITRDKKTTFDKAKAIEDYLTTNYGYDLDIPPLKPGDEATDILLFQDKRGFCQQFATAMVVLLRLNGVPSRVVTGYAPGVYNPITGLFTVRAKDAHSWVEVRFEEHGWVPFNPTPSVPASVGDIANAWLSNQWGGRLFEIGLGYVIGPGLSALSSLLGGLLALILGSALGLAILPAMAIIVLLILMGWRAHRRRRSVSSPRAIYADGPRRSMVQLYNEMIDFLANQRLPRRRASETPLEYAATLSLDAGHEEVDWLTRAVVSASYDPRPFDPHLVKQSKGVLRRLKALKQRLRG